MQRQSGRVFESTASSYLRADFAVSCDASPRWSYEKRLRFATYIVRDAKPMWRAPPDSSKKQRRHTNCESAAQMKINFLISFCALLSVKAVQAVPYPAESSASAEPRFKVNCLFVCPQGYYHDPSVSDCNCVPKPTSQVRRFRFDVTFT